MNYILNLFGTGVRYWICEIPIPVYEEMKRIKLKHHVEWETLMFDFDFLKHFGFNHWSELSDQKEVIGFYTTQENRIEIKKQTKFVARFRAKELLSEQTLFNLYNTKTTNLVFDNKENSKRIIILEYQKGLIGKFEFIKNEFTVDQLEFQLLTLASETWISDIYIDKQSLVLKKEDTVSIGTKVIIL